MGSLRIAPLYPLLDDRRIAPARLPLAALALARAGCPIVQLRLKASDDRERLAIQRAVAAALAGTGVTLCINDRADLACVLRDEAAPGLTVALHLGQADLPPRIARELVGPSVVLGWSTHDADQVRRAQALPIDYLGFGPIFATGSKDNPDPTVGLDGLRAAAAASRLPIVAIGGIDAARARAVRDAGAAAVAMISGLLVDGEGAIEAVARRLTKELA